MNIDRAWSALLWAGRELGSGPAAVVPRIAPGISEHLLARGVLTDYAHPIALGAVLGLVMPEDPHTLAHLDDIHRDWLHQAGG
jgi:hypothetical protein